jgi:hypothetical protein
MRTYTLAIFKTTHAVPLSGTLTTSKPLSPAETVPLTGMTYVEHSEIATYDGLTSPPWVPPQGSFFRFRDPSPPGRPTDHNEVTGYVDQVVTCFYGTRTTIEIYLKDKA